MASRSSSWNCAHSGIGRAIASGFVDAGADLALADIAGDPLESLRSELAHTGRRVVAQRVDVTATSDVDAFHRQTLAELGHVDVLVNSAGITLRTAAEDFPEADWEHILAVNLTGTFRVCQVFGRSMLAAGCRRI